MYSNSKFNLGRGVGALVDDPQIMNNQHQLNPMTSPAPRPKIGQTIGDLAGSRSGVGRLHKAGIGTSIYDEMRKARPVSKPTTPGGYDGSGINPSAGRPGAVGGMRNPKLSVHAPRGRRGFFK